MGQGIQEWTMQNLRKTVFKIFESISNFFKAVFHKFYSVNS